MGTVDSRATTRQLLESEEGSSIRNDKFKLEHIPTVYPTMEDFQNRPKYMEMLHKYYGKYGMVKIVPPERWNIPFRLDTEVSMREGRYMGGWYVEYSTMMRQHFRSWKNDYSIMSLVRAVYF